MARVKVNVNHITPITLSSGVDSVSVVSSIGSASINNDVLYLDFPIAETENFTLNNQTVTGASISGADVTFDTSTGIANVSISGADVLTVNGSEVSAVSITGADVNIESDTAIVSISSGGSGGGNVLSVNGDTVTGMTFGGAADVSIDSGIANIVVNSTIAADIEAVSVVGGDLNASVNNKTLYLYTPAKPNLQSANFTVPEGITVPAFTNTTITAERLGDGYIAPIAQNGLTWKRINATQFVLKANTAGDYLAGMTLTETANYYSAAKNIPVHVTSNDALKILMHFDDQYNLIKNEGTASITSPASIDSSNYSADGKFGGCLNNYNNAITTDITDFGARSFTVDIQVYRGIYQPNFYLNNNNYNNYFCIMSDGIVSFSFTGLNRNGTVPCISNEFNHIALCYDASASVLRTFVNGVLDITAENYTYTPHQLILKMLQSKFDELRVLDGVCQWTEDFTPPSEPY